MTALGTFITRVESQAPDPLQLTRPGLTFPLEVVPKTFGRLLIRYVHIGTTVRFDLKEFELAMGHCF